MPQTSLSCERIRRTNPRTRPLLPQSSAGEVFTTFTNESGFDSRALVYLVGWVQTCLATGQDAAVHMAEETKNASKAVPLAIFWANFLVRSRSSDTTLVVHLTLVHRPTAQDGSYVGALRSDARH